LVVKKPLPEPLGPSNPVVDGFPTDSRYDYQDHVVDRLLRHGQIIAQVATGGGKTRIAKLCHARIARPTLFLTTRGILMHQMKDIFIADLKMPVGVFGDDQWTAPQRMNVGMVQTFTARLRDDDPRREETLRLLERFEFVILEEAHEASSNSYYDVMRACKNAHYRLALTATPFMKDSEEANLRLEACSGPVAIRVTEKTLIERGILATPYFKFIELPPPPKMYRSTPWQKAYELGVVKNEARNLRICTEAVRASKHGLSVMVLVQRREHGEILSRMMTEAGLVANFIWGEHEQDERKAAINALKRGSLNVLIGSTILDVGVDVPAVGMVILAGAGKAEVALRQRIGRGLRAKASGPNVCFVVDFSDPLNNHLVQHARTRREIIETTEGFSDRIIEGDFPYELFSLPTPA
jgi:superfamily II DNA or RNA helicase